MPLFAFAEKKLGEAALEGKTLTAPTKYFLALTENAITRDMTGKEVGEAAHGAELTYENYGRVEVKLEAATWTFTAGTSSNPAKWVNKSAIVLKNNTAATGKNKATHFALLDAATVGNGWFYGTLTEELTITTAITTLEFAAGLLEITME